MFQDVWQLTKLSLTIDARRPGQHAIRFGLAITLYLAVIYSHSLSWSSTSGRHLFQSQLLITAFFLAMTTVFGFSQTITEEKEEETLGLIRLADISSLAIILGKSAGLFCDAALLIAVQFPFTIIAITLGGISWPQVTAGYVALVALLWLLVNVGVLVSVLQPTGATAARLAAIVLCLYIFPPFIESFSPWGTDYLYALYRPISLFIRLREISDSSFDESSWCWAVGSGGAMGLVCLCLSWWLFDRVALAEHVADAPPRLKKNLNGSRRCWSRALLWREYIFVNGGLRWTAIRIAVPLAIMSFMAFHFQSNPYYLGMTFAWSAIWCGFFGILDGTWSASRLFRDEIRYRTWSALVQTPHSLKELAWGKSYGWALALAPSIASPFLLIFAMLRFHERIPREFWTHVELIVGTATIGISIFGYLHLLVLLSLYFGWKATPMALTICFAAGWMYVATVFSSGMDNPARCTIFGITAIAILILMLWLQHRVIVRLGQLAETA